MRDDARQFTLTLSQVLPASPVRIYGAMTDPTQLGLWWGPEGFTCPEVLLDVRVGGRYRIAMQPPEGLAFHLVGEYLVVEPPSHLIYTFRWDPPDPDDRPTTVQLALHRHPDGTRIELNHGVFATHGRRQLHEAGWTETMQRLATHLETTVSDPQGPPAV